MRKMIFQFSKNERWYLLITEKFLLWNFRRWKMWSFFVPKSWWKYVICYLLKSSCFELYGDGKYGIFFSQKVDGTMIFTWSFWVFHFIPGLGKYGFSCNEFGHRWKSATWKPSGLNEKALRQKLVKKWYS